MGLIERKEREKEDMRRLILNAARSLFLEQGYEKTSIRGIAEAIEYSPATIYLYYKDKNDLFFALHQEAFQKLIFEFQDVMDIEDPFERLAEMGQHYLKYAFENPELYDLMFMMKSPIENLACKEEIWEDGHIALGMLKSIVAECIEKQYFKNPDIEASSMMIWANVHGLVTLQLKNRTMMFPENERLPRIFSAFELFLKTIKTGL
jgi:AcrR family transcriptional regulator